MAVLKEYGEKGTLSISHYSTLVLKIKAGGMFEKGKYINEYRLVFDYGYTPRFQVRGNLTIMKK